VVTTACNGAAQQYIHIQYTISTERQSVDCNLGRGPVNST